MSNPIDIAIRPEVTAFLDRDSNSTRYIAKDAASSSCAEIGCVMDIDYAAGCNS